jgi:CheY-like chemotaxis protein
MENNIPNMDGIEATTTIKAKHPAILTLVDKDLLWNN